MKVRAVRLGYYDLKRRHPGEVFVLSDPKHFSDAGKPDLDLHGKTIPGGWMEAVDELDEEPVQKPKSKRLRNQDVI